LRDQLNFHRLVGFGEALPAVRADVDRQLRRHVLDAERVLAAMLRVIDIAGLRVGNDVYAEENDSYGLSTLTKRHVAVHGSTVDLRFPAKSGAKRRCPSRTPGWQRSSRCSSSRPAAAGCSASAAGASARTSSTRASRTSPVLSSLRRT